MSTLTPFPQETYGNGIVTNQAFDPAMDRVTSVQIGSNGGVRNLSYAWNEAGNLTSRTNSTFSVTESFGYDLLDRLLTSKIGSATKTIAYDALGDITAKSDVGTYAYPAAGAARPHGVTSIAGAVESGPNLPVTNPTYAYDANGRMTSGGGRTLTYAGFDAPQTIANGASSVSFTFDDSLQRSKQVAPEGATVYIAAAGVLTEKFTQAGTGQVTWRSYIMAGGQRIGMVTEVANSGSLWGGSNKWRLTGNSCTGMFSWSAAAASTVTYFHQDHLGSVIALTGSSGALVEQDAYDPWGKRRNTNGADDTNDTITSQTIRGFTDQERLADSALIHMNARVYDPQIGKFTGTDPLDGNAGGSWNRYAYGSGNPLRYTDPTGMELAPS